MSNIGLNQNISIGGRQFHLQTATNIEEGFIRTEVFEQGRLLFIEYFEYERRDTTLKGETELRIRRLLDQFHQSVISELETIFEISHILKEKEDSISHLKIGAIFLSLHLFDKAESHLLRAIDLDSDLYSAFILLGRCYFLQKRYHKAAQTLEPLIKARIDYPDLYNLYGLILMEQKNYVQALNQFRQAIKLNPDYKEAYFYLATTIIQRIGFLKMQNKKEEIQRDLKFFALVLKKIRKIGNQEDKNFVSQVEQALNNKKLEAIYSLMYDYYNKNFYQKTPVEVVGYEFYLWLKYLPEQLDCETLSRFEARISQAISQNPNYPDLWNYLALIHLMLCRDYFLKGLDNFKEATKINPRFVKARKNLRLVENDGREFLSLIKAIVKD